MPNAKSLSPTQQRCRLQDGWRTYLLVRPSQRLVRCDAEGSAKCVWYRWHQRQWNSLPKPTTVGGRGVNFPAIAARLRASGRTPLRVKYDPRATAVRQEDPLGVPAVHGPERRQAGPVEPRPCEAKNRKAKRDAGPKSRSAAKLSEQLSRRRIISRRRGTGCAANRSLRAAHRWQRRCAERPDNVPPQKRPDVREDAGGFCQLQRRMRG